MIIAGGSVGWNKDQTAYEPAFKNAKYWTNEAHWDWAIQPNAREKASFLKENLIPMQQSGQLFFVKRDNSSFLAQTELGFGVLFVDGHTEKQMIPHIKYKNKTLVFTADLLPTVGHIPLPYIMGYDTRPLLTLDEKASFLEKATKEEYYLFLEHDAHKEICTLQNTDKGVRLKNIHRFDEIFN